MSTSTTTADPATTGPSIDPNRGKSRLLFWSAAAVAILLIPIFFAQVFWARILITPWYLPIGGTAAALVTIYALGRPVRWGRAGVVAGCVALACLEWYFVLAMTLLPQYTGPIAEGSSLPAFHATLADGTEIDESYFRNRPMTALVFFQGRWCPFCMTQLRELEDHGEEFRRIGAEVAVVSIEDVATAAQTKQDFPSLTVVSDEQRELSNAIDLINRGFAPDGGDSAAPTIVLVDDTGTVRWLHRPTRFIARPSAAELATTIERQMAK
jgi:peroxiredoxin